MKKIMLASLVLFTTTVYAQTQKGATAVYDGDTIAAYSLPVVDIYGFIPANASQNLVDFMRLRRNVIKAYPYAKIASAELRYINETVEKMDSEKEKKRFIKEQEKIMKDQFEKDLKNLTYSQGKILIKLIDRETGSTSYDLVKELRGSLQAFFWQGLAKLFSANLKTQYDPEGSDKDIERIVQSIERGELEVVRR
jgi:hypothetical protein